MSETVRQDRKVGVVTLESLNKRLQAIVDDNTRGKPVRVQGIASNVSRTRSSHVHLRLRQGKYGMACVVFRGMARELPFWIGDGQELLIQGQIEVDPVWGELQIVAHHVELQRPALDRDGLGGLEARARAAGWLAPDRKRPLPRTPQRVGLVAGEQSKARTDVTSSLAGSGIGAQVVFKAASMQGPGAAEEIRKALEALNSQPDVDLIVIARGGGSPGQLATFDDWDLAEHIVNSRAPIVTAIGHHQDRTLADLVADSSVPTPSLVASALAEPPVQRRDMVIVVAVAVAAALFLAAARVLGWW